MLILVLLTLFVLFAFFMLIVFVVVVLLFFGFHLIDGLGKAGNFKVVGLPIEKTCTPSEVSLTTLKSDAIGLFV